MSARMFTLAAGLAVAATTTTAHAQAADVVCHFTDQAVLDDLSAAGVSGALANQGFVAVPGHEPYYETAETIDVGVWVDDAFLATTTDAAALALTYFEHANCVFATGKNLSTGTGVHQVSLRLAGDRIRYYAHTTPNAPGSTAPWGQHYNWDWAQAMKAMPGVPKVNVLFTTNLGTDPTVNPDGSLTYGVLGFGGAANGLGQGNAIVAVAPGWFADGMSWLGLARNFAEDWWGLIAAHEVGHAISGQGHIAQQYDTMCCSGADYPASTKGTTASENYAVAQTTWDLIVDNDTSDVDNYPDPYRITPNPEDGATWSYDDISDFMSPRSGGDVYVAPSTGSSFAARTLRHDWFCINDEVCLTGDFDGDGREDVVAFTRGTTGDVYVALAADAGGFAGTGVKWHDWFAINSETPVVGDWNGDGKDDIASITGGTAADVYVALSNGHGFVGTGLKWHDNFAGGTELPLVGDYNGDGKDDLASFTRGTTGDVFVTLSTGTGFGARKKWHDFFSINSELPVAGDWNGDGKDDLATLTRGTTGDVYVTFSTGSAFSGTGLKWHDFFCINSELPFAGDVDGDGKDDLVSFGHDANGRVYVARSSGAAFVGTNAVWTSNLCLTGDTCGLADTDGDGRVDALGFHRHD